MMDKDYKKFLLELARKVLEKYVKGGETYTVDEGEVPTAAKSIGGTFVTLTIDGELRGCIGSLQSSDEVYKGVISNTINAAVHDPRFSPVRADELGAIKIEVSLLTPMEELSYDDEKELLARLVPGKDGVFIESRGMTATYLPEVWEHFSSKEEFLSSLCVKGGLSPHAWKDGKEFKVFIYHTEKFGE